MDEFYYVFESLGCVEREYNIKLKAASHPTIQPQGNVPLRLRENLADLKTRGIIAEVKEPVDWVSNVVK